MRVPATGWPGGGAARRAAGRPKQERLAALRAAG
eukprot:CAMPEP_0116919046 /NCGR_PEP_ID=MMETSP0467-20121206/20133_1 /TAXON_ID=283647 /ORGANISM="Mesodinium pulex, Strain SPMC105" /LENGTH=33 /DNA_ID= /DNA_START= /DNA_END= /DNA_ORIENTATION=